MHVDRNFQIVSTGIDDRVGTERKPNPILANIAETKNCLIR